MSIVRLDFETRSTVDIKATGVYPYAAHPSTDIWCMAYAFDDEEPLLWRPDLPADPRLVEHIKAGGEMHAWNAQFERNMWGIMRRRYGWPMVDLGQWHCSMALAASYGLPLSLDQSSRALGLDITKDSEGHRLMMQMCRPRRVEGDKVVWWDVAEKLIRLGEYCKQDVRTERAVSQRLEPMPDSERRVWLLDQTINDRGMGLDHELAQAAMEFSEIAVDKANRELASLTDGEVSITNAASLASWLNKNGMSTKGVAKAAVSEMLKRPSTEVVEKVLRIRQEAAKSSAAKYDTMLAWGSAPDGRMHGMLQYHGAHTGRWAGRGPQPQNFPRGTVENIEAFVPLVLERDVETVDLLAPPMEVVSTMLRSAMKAAPGRRLLAADYAAIEARVVAWLAGQSDLVADFAAGRDIYKVLASDIFGVPVDSIGKGSMERFVGKTAVLGLGFQMGAGRFKDTCYLQGGVTISDDLAKRTVDAYRTKYDSIKRLWAALESAAICAVSGEPKKLKACDVSYRYDPESNFLFCRLPSGREIKYFDPIVQDEPLPWDAAQTRPRVTVMGMDSFTKQWTRYGLYGGLQTENIVQAVARDLLAEAMLRLEESGYAVVLTVHDEVICERDKGAGSLEEFMELMKTTPSWADGCPVNVEGWEGERYKK